jgi:hypothetical protein
MVSSGRRDPTNGVALEDLSIGSTEDFISDGRGERTSPSPVTQTGLRKSLATAHAPARVAAEIAKATGSGFP